MYAHDNVLNDVPIVLNCTKLANKNVDIKLPEAIISNNLNWSINHSTPNNNNAKGNTNNLFQKRIKVGVFWSSILTH